MRSTGIAEVAADALQVRIAALEARLAGVGLRGIDLMSARPLVSPIIDDAAHYTGFSRAEIVSSRREQALTRVRFAIYWAAREATPHSLPEIGRAIGGRDHTTIIWGLRRAETLREIPTFRVLSDLLAANAHARTVQEVMPCPL